MPRGLRAVTLLIVCWLVGLQVHAVIPSHPGETSIFGNWATEAVQMLAAVLCAARARGLAGHERRAWNLIAAGIVAWTLGDVYWNVFLDADVVPVPSIADAGYLLFIPLVLAGMVMLMHARLPRVPRTVIVDAVIVLLAAGTIGAVVVVDPVAETATGDTLAIATNLAYPVCDLVLLGVVIAAIALRGWRLDRTWSLLGAGVIVFWVADSLYLVGAANGTYTTPSLYDVGWPASTLLLALAAWQQPPPAQRPSQQRHRMHEVVLPMTLACAALIAVVLGTETTTRVPAVILGLGCMVAVMTRLAMTFRENIAMLEASRFEAATDDLTGLGNRRALMSALERQLPLANDARPLVLALFDLDGFKGYNDTFGHPAGDAVLARLGGALGRAVARRGTAYRMGGDEFGVLIEPGSEVAQPILEAAASALSDRGEGFEVGCSYGSIVLPREATEIEEALRLADQRMYAAKNRGRRSAGRQSKDVLLRAMAERDPRLGAHIADVARLAEAVATRLGLPVDHVERVRHAAELHDIGKVAIPDAILHKPGPLDAHEWEFIRSHTVIGERIIAAAPDLEGVAVLVRSSHERFDGAGYPDGLGGTEIPLGARIVAVCDAFDAMVTNRSYRRGVAAEAAIAELRRCAGTQFDPVVVEAFCGAWADHGNELSQAEEVRQQL